MGAWGTGLYQDDVAEDIKADYYNCFREDGLDNEAAYRKMLSLYSQAKDDPEDGPVFWMALADVMWNLGKLNGEVKEKALYHIGSGKDAERWEAEGRKKADKRRKVLEKLKEKLESPMPEEKKLRKKRILRNKWQTGDMYTMPVEREYPRFPGMKAKYLLLIKVGDRKDLTDNIQPVVYIKYLEEEYHEGIDVNGLEFSRCYGYSYYFIIGGIAGRPKPKELTYVGNYGDISRLKRPDGPEPGVEQLTCNSIRYVKALEDVCVSGYLMYKLGVDGHTISGDDIYMTEQEYQEECRRHQEYEKKWQAERKAGEYYRCPWEDGDTFYLPVREGTEGGRLLAENGYTGTVMVKVGAEEDYHTTNLWPEMLACCVRKEYGSTEDIIRDDVFNQCFMPLEFQVFHGKDQSVPEELRLLGNIPDIYSRCKRMRKMTGSSWRLLEDMRLKYGVIYYQHWKEQTSGTDTD